MSIFNAIMTNNYNQSTKESTMQYAISESQNFQGSFIAHTPEGDIQCANLATARSYIPGTNEYRRMQAQRPIVMDRPRASIQCLGFVSPSGQYYAVVEMPTMDIRIDCHNVHTLRNWMQSGVSPETLLEAFRNPDNVRRSGGWAS